jgi:hypothetical protein
MAHAKWYQKPKFKKPFPAEKLGDGSTAEVIDISIHPNDGELARQQAKPGSILLVIRQWPNGNTDRVRITKDERGNPRYELAKQDRFGQAVPFIGDPDWHPPYVHSNAIPVTSPSSIETFDLGTGREHASRKKLDEYYEQHNLALYSKAELLNMHDKTPPKASKEPIRGTFRGSMPLAPEGAMRSVVKADLTKVT